MNMPITTRNNAAAAAAVDAKPAQPGAVQVIYRFDGEALQKKDGVLGTGVGAQRDRTHQLVQHQAANGKWQVHVQSLNEGCINPSQYVFTSNRPVTIEDFNNPDSVLSQKAREATARLNADSNRLPDAAAPQTPPSSAAAPAKKMSTVEWLGQQGRNTVGGVSAAVTSTAGMVGSLPEKAGRFAGSVGDLGRAGVNRVTGGRVAKSALNPMVIDSHVKSRSGPTNAEKGMGWVQGGIDKAIGADANSETYKTVEVVAPLLIARKGRTGGDQGTTQRALPASTQSGPIAAATPTTVKMTRTQAQPGNPINNPAIRASNSPVRVVKNADGSVQLSKANGQPVSLDEVVRAVANGRLTPKQLEQAKFGDASIQGIVRDAAQLKGSTGAKPASTPVKNSEAPELPADILSNTQQTMKSPDFQKRLADSNTKGEVARQNQAIKDMRADGKGTASHIRPEGGGQPGSAHNEPQPQRQAKPENTTPRETQHAADPASKPQLNVKPARAEMNLKPGNASSETSTSGKLQNSSSKDVAATKPTLPLGAGASGEGFFTVEPSSDTGQRLQRINSSTSEQDIVDALAQVRGDAGLTSRGQLKKNVAVLLLTDSAGQSRILGARARADTRIDLSDRLIDLPQSAPLDGGKANIFTQSNAGNLAVRAEDAERTLLESAARLTQSQRGAGPWRAVLISEIAPCAACSIAIDQFTELTGTPVETYTTAARSGGDLKQRLAPRLP